MRRRCGASIAAVSLLAMSVIAQPAASESDWTILQSLDPDSRISVLLPDGDFIDGRFKAWSPGAIEIASKRRVQTFRVEDVRRVTVRQKSSRWKGTLIGALIGFGVAFPIGAASAGYIMDRNDPGFAGRAVMGAGVGMFGAGIGAPIGALTGGHKHALVYRAPVVRAGPKP